MESTLKKRMITLVALLVVLSDQITKIAIVRSFELGEILSVIPGFFNLTLTHNKGIAFGMLSGLPDSIRIFVLIGATGIALGLLVYFLLKEFASDVFGQFGIALVLGGALGNIIDRIRLGYVIDFLDVFYGSYHWPAFNIADSAICIGVGILLLRSCSACEETPAPEESA